MSAYCMAPEPDFQPVASLAARSPNMTRTFLEWVRTGRDAHAQDILAQCWSVYSRRQAEASAHILTRRVPRIDNFGRYDHVPAQPAREGARLATEARPVTRSRIRRLQLFSLEPQYAA